jgi:hypothetical protein
MSKPRSSARTLGLALVLSAAAGCNDVYDLPGVEHMRDESSAPDASPDDDKPSEEGHDERELDAATDVPDAAPVPPPEPEPESDGEVPPVSQGDGGPDGGVDAGNDAGNGKRPEADAGEDAAPPTALPSYGPFVTMLSSADQAVQQGFGPGKYRAADGDLDSFGSVMAAHVYVPPATRVRLCTTDDGGNGVGCKEYRNDTGLAALAKAIDDSLLGGIAYMEVEPFAILYQGANFTSQARSFGYGEYRANVLAPATGALGNFADGTPVNDRAMSVFVPPGVRVRACSVEGGLNQHGGERCLTYREPHGDLFEIIGLSYIQVEPVVSVFAEAYGNGVSESFGPGDFLAREGGLARLGNETGGTLFVPAELTARLCSGDFHESGSGDCATYRRSQLTLPAKLEHKVSYVSVTPLQSPRMLSLTVVPGTAEGVVTSNPHGLVCQGSPCQAMFHSHTLVQLTAKASPLGLPTWEGCHRQSSTQCEVFALDAASVSVRFDKAPEACVAECVAECPKTHKKAYEACASECKLCLDF